MHERFTGAARQVVIGARQEAANANAGAIGTEHLLVGLLQHGKGLSAILVRDGLSVELVRRKLSHRSVPAGAGEPHEMPFASDATRAFRIGAEEADRLKDAHVATHHLLLGVLSNESAGARDVMKALGVDAATLRSEILGILEHVGRARPPRVLRASNAVQIAPTRLRPVEGTRSHGAPDSWNHQGFDLKTIIAEVYHLDESRIDWPSTLDDAVRYDVEVYLPEFEGQDEIHRLVREAIPSLFDLQITRETQNRDVYVLTASDGPAPNRRPVPHGGGFLVMGSTSSLTRTLGAAPGPRSMREMLRHMAGASPTSLSGSTDMARLCASLGRSVGRPVLDETGLSGHYEINVTEQGERLEDFFRALRDQAGLIVTAARRDVEMLVVRAR